MVFLLGRDSTSIKCFISLLYQSRDGSQEPAPPSRPGSSEAFSTAASKKPVAPSGPSKKGGGLSIADFLQLKSGLKPGKQAPVAIADKVGGRLKSSSAQGPSQSLQFAGPREGEKKGIKLYEEGLSQIHRGKSSMGPKKKKLTSLKKKILMVRRFLHYCMYFENTASRFKLLLLNTRNLESD